MKRVHVVLILAILALLLAGGSWWWKTSMEKQAQEKQENATESTRKEAVDDAQYMDVLTWLPGDNVGVDVNGNGILEDRDVILRKGRNNALHIRFTWVPEGFGEFVFQKGWLSVSLQGQNTDVEMKCTADDNVITCPFISENVEKDTITISFDKIDYLYQFSLNTQDPSFFFASLGITKENVTFEGDDWLRLEDVQIISSYTMGDEDHIYAKGFPHPDLPETLKYSFISKEKEFGSAYLEVYPVKDGLLPSQYPESITSSFVFPAQVINLDRVLTNRPEKIGNQWGSIADYPRVGASPINVQKEKYIETKDFVGIRYALDYTQSVSAADYLTYTFQGITKNKKYFLLFRYASLYSPRLEKVLKEEEKGIVEYDDEFIHRSFEELAKENNFSPSFEVLDDFVESISLHY